MNCNGQILSDPSSPRTIELRSLLRTYENAGDLQSLLSTLHSSPHSMREGEIAYRISDTANCAIEHAVAANDITRIRELLTQWREAAEANAQMGNGDAGSSHLNIREEILAVAVRNRNRDIAELLMQNGVGVGGEVVRAIQDEFEKLDTDVAALLDVLDGLVASGWDVNAELKDPHYRHAIRLAVHERQTSSSSSSSTNETPFLDWLLAHNASPNITSTHWSMCTTSTYTIFIEPKQTLASLASMRKLLAHGAAPDANVLHKAIRLPKSHPDRIPMIELQLSHGADVNALEAGMWWTCNGKFPYITHATPLFEAVVAEDVGVVRMLAGWGADARVRSEVEHCASMKTGLNALEAMRASRDEEIRALADERWGKETRAQERERRDVLASLGPRRVVRTKTEHSKENP
ncbi:hypothetical protein DM02DRAFT_703474 [Periconia macrospinosa]|uniref:Uncharacterized protein n=1 Tax=Periconia macrospinosa TaxID=97972 RepID=A0A2V1EAT6_9PLEO|nr:hypothetical protein DM02DRAFT_703474 [Periconia macrospinosa]